MDWVALLTALGAFVGGLTGLSALVNVYSQRKKAKADSQLALDVLNDRVLNRTKELIDDQEKRIDRQDHQIIQLQNANTTLTYEIGSLKNELSAIRQQNKELAFVVETALIGINILTSQLVNAGVDPVWAMPASLQRWVQGNYTGRLK